MSWDVLLGVVSEGIDAQASRDKAAAAYICDVIAKNEQALFAAYDPKQEWSDDERKIRLYCAIEQSFHELAKKKKMRVEMTQFFEDDTPPVTPEVAAGWVRYTNPGNGRGFVLELTQQGMDVLSQYRSLRGLKSLDDIKQDNETFWSQIGQHQV